MITPSLGLHSSLHLPGTVSSASDAASSVVETIAILLLDSTTITGTAVPSTTGVVAVDGTTISWRHEGVTLSDGQAFSVGFDGLEDSTTTASYQATTVAHPTYVGSAPSVSDEPSSSPALLPFLLEHQHILPREPATPPYSYTPTSFHATLRTTSGEVSGPISRITNTPTATTSLTGLSSILTSSSTSQLTTSTSTNSSTSVTPSSSSVLTLTGTNVITLPGTVSGASSTAVSTTSAALSGTTSAAAASSGSSSTSTAAAAPVPRIGAGKTIALLAALSGVIAFGL